MNTSGDADLLISARSALLDALEALSAQRDAVIVIGAQAIYMHTGTAGARRAPRRQATQARRTSSNTSPADRQRRHDIYRLLVATTTDQLSTSLQRLRDNELAGPATDQALIFLSDLFASGPNALGAMMAGRAEEGVGDPANVAASAAVLAEDLIAATIKPPRPQHQA